MDEQLLAPLAHRERVLVLLIEEDVAPRDRRLRQVKRKYLGIAREVREAVGVELHDGGVADALEEVGAGRLRGRRGAGRGCGVHGRNFRHGGGRSRIEWRGGDFGRAVRIRATLHPLLPRLPVRTTASAILPMILLASAAQAQKHPMTVDDMLAMQRISEAQVSPDGKSVVFTVRTTDMDANKGRNDLWLAAVDGSGARPLTNHPASDSGGRWAPDGKSIYFLSARGGSSQVWRIATDGGEAQPITNFPLDVGNFLVFPDGKQFVVTMEVYPGTSPPRP